VVNNVRTTDRKLRVFEVLLAEDNQYTLFLGSRLVERDHFGITDQDVSVVKRIPP
jgi:hypothetical protein